MNPVKWGYLAPLTYLHLLGVHPKIVPGVRVTQHVDRPRDSHPYIVRGSVPYRLCRRGVLCSIVAGGAGQRVWSSLPRGAIIQVNSDGRIPRYHTGVYSGLS